MKYCNYCHQGIHWILVNGKNRACNDIQGSSRHVCNEFKNTRTSLHKQVANLEDTVEGLKNLTSKILTKINKLEQRREQNES